MRLWPLPWWRRECEDSTPPNEEAAQQRLNKSAKIQTALEGTLVNSLFQIDKNERSNVQRYTEMQLRKMGVPAVNGHAGKKQGDEDDGMLIADNISIRNIKPPSLLPPLLGLSALVAAGGWAASMIPPDWFKDEPPEVVRPDDPPPVHPRTHSRDIYDYRIDTRVIPPGEENE